MNGHHAAGPATDWMALTEPPVLWLNTVLLIVASIAMEAAKGAVRRGKTERAGTELLLGGLLTLAFLGGQFYAWAQVRHSEFFSPANPAVAFFYVLTAVHGLHLLGGLYVWGRTVVRIRKPDVEAIDVRQGSSRASSCAACTGTSCCSSGWACSP